MMKPYSIQAPEDIAKEYGGNKQKIAEAAKMGLVDPTAAVMAGMFIDRIRGAQAQEQAQQPTVAEQVFNTPKPALGNTPQAAQMQAMQQQYAPRPGARGMDRIPTDPNMMPSAAGGGLVAFAEGGRPADRAALLQRKSQLETALAQLPQTYKNFESRDAIRAELAKVNESLKGAPSLGRQYTDDTEGMGVYLTPKGLPRSNVSELEMTQPVLPYTQKYELPRDVEKHVVGPFVGAFKNRYDELESAFGTGVEEAEPLPEYLRSPSPYLQRDLGPQKGNGFDFIGLDSLPGAKPTPENVEGTNVEGTNVQDAGPKRDDLTSIPQFISGVGDARTTQDSGFKVNEGVANAVEEQKQVDKQADNITSNIKSVEDLKAEYDKALAPKEGSTTTAGAKEESNAEKMLKQKGERREYTLDDFKGVTTDPNYIDQTQEELKDLLSDDLGEGEKAALKYYAEADKRLADQQNKDMWMAVANFGFNLAASDSPYFAQAAGQAGKEATKMLIDQSKERRKAKQEAIDKRASFDVIRNDRKIQNLKLMIGKGSADQDRELKAQIANLENQRAYSLQNMSLASQERIALAGLISQRELQDSRQAHTTQENRLNRELESSVKALDMAVRVSEGDKNRGFELTKQDRLFAFEKARQEIEWVNRKEENRLNRDAQERIVMAQLNDPSDFDKQVEREAAAMREDAEYKDFSPAQIDKIAQRNVIAANNASNNALKMQMFEIEHQFEINKEVADAWEAHEKTIIMSPQWRKMSQSEKDKYQANFNYKKRQEFLTSVRSGLTTPDNAESFTPIQQGAPQEAIDMLKADPSDTNIKFFMDTFGYTKDQVTQLLK